MQTYTATDISTLVTSVVDATRSFDEKMLWWRGHASNEWKVHPSLYHKGLAAYEANMAVRFMNYGRVRHRDVPNGGDRPAWLFLMQHYGLPTRLLDWSQSPLTALYFAVRESEFENQDGVVWGLLQTYLNKEQVGENQILGIGNKFVKPLFDDAWKASSNVKGDGKVVAISAQHVDVRQMVQASEFTLHGTSQPINELQNADQFLINIKIPAAAKRKISQTLALFNITESYLFPDLEHLAKELREKKYDIE